MFLDWICCAYWIIGIGLYVLKFLSVDFDSATSFGKLQPPNRQISAWYGKHSTLWRSTYCIAVITGLITLSFREVWFFIVPVIEMHSLISTAIIVGYFSNRIPSRDVNIRVSGGL